MKTALDKAAELVGLDQAERRVLVMYNSRNEYPTTTTLTAAYQVLLPGEFARTHRHTANAGRLTLDVGEKTYTVVDGTRIELERGDVVLTPNWGWHGHGNDGTQSSYWLDFTDAAVVLYLDAWFYEPYPDGVQTSASVSETSEYLFRWKDTCARLATAPRHNIFGTRIALGNPAFRSMNLYMQRLAAGERNGPFRTTSVREYCVVEGRGTSVMEGSEYSWGPGDVMIAPSWNLQEHRATTDSVLFVMTDEPLVDALGLLRVQSNQGE